MAWDWVNHKLYWTTVGSPTVDSTIEVMDTDNCYRKVLARYNDGTKARAIVLDPINGYENLAITDMCKKKCINSIF